MAALDKDQQAFIVQSHARFRKTSLIVRDVKAEFGIDVSRQQVLFYNPERGGKKRISKEWQELFDKTRKEYLEGQYKVGIQHQTYRLELLQRIADHAEEIGNLVLAKDAAKQAAEEVGGAFTNKRVLTGPNDTALIPPSVTIALDKVYGGDPTEGK